MTNSCIAAANDLIESGYEPIDNYYSAAYSRKGDGHPDGMYKKITLNLTFVKKAEALNCTPDRYFKVSFNFTNNGGLITDVWASRLKNADAENRLSPTWEEYTAFKRMLDEFVKEEVM